LFLLYDTTSTEGSRSAPWAASAGALGACSGMQGVPFRGPRYNGVRRGKFHAVMRRLRAFSAEVGTGSAQKMRQTHWSIFRRSGAPVRRRKCDKRIESRAHSSSAESEGDSIQVECALARHDRLGGERRLAQLDVGERRALLEPRLRRRLAPQRLPLRVAQRPADRLETRIDREVVAGE